MIQTTENKLQLLFREKKDILSVFFTAGFPKLEDTTEVLLALQDSGADLVEIGMPFSDPIADGPTIQESNAVAINNGITIDKILDQLESIKDKLEIPIVLMGYLNPVVQYGFQKFLDRCSAIGVSGTILPDVPMYEYQSYYKEAYEDSGLVNVFLVTPQTSEKRIKEIDQISNGFIYLVATAGTTGARKGITEEQISYFKRINDLKLNNPGIVGFGISNHESFKTACKYSGGAIIGSAFINLLKESKNLKEDIDQFIKSIRGVS
ncbi:MAG: tryptophan synthase subunit alpha [Bacteroidota bacterium]